MKPLPITIECECGERREVPYGEVWVCERCGRRWNTQQIPAEEYEGLLRRMRRFRLEVLGFALVAAAVLVPLIVFVNASFIFLAPIAAAIWLFLYLPNWRRRARRAAREAPHWELHPE
jgi:Flp pilus assembly protein TadB